jgi:hypothetical protein
MDKNEFNQIYKRTKTMLKNRIQCCHIFDKIKEVNTLADEIFEICKDIEEVIVNSIQIEVINDPEMLKYHEYDP